MNKEQALNGLDGTIYHELGHLIGYLLSNNQPSSSLGDVLEFNIGLNQNCVTPANNYYHFKKKNGIEKERERIKENTKNVPRTIAWYIEVILGCLTQSIVENGSFYDYYGLDKIYGRNKVGYHDCSNRNFVKTAAHYTPDKIFFEKLRDDISNLLIEKEIIQKLREVVDEIKEDIRNTEQYQKKYENQALSELQIKITNVLDKAVYVAYNQIIKDNTEDLKNIPESRIFPYS